MGKRLSAKPENLSSKSHDCLYREEERGLGELGAPPYDRWSPVKHFKGRFGSHAFSVPR